MKQLIGTKNALLLLAMAVVVVAGVLVWMVKERPAQENVPSSTNPPATAHLPKPAPVAQASFTCNGGKTVTAAFFQGAAKAVKPGEPPQPSGSVNLTLSDGRKLELPQTISADGIRYANADESFVFWSKGNAALVTENGAEKNYVGCVVQAPDPGGLPQAFHGESPVFFIRYPADYAVDAAYVNTEFGPGKDIKGVKFTIPASLATGTNLSSYDTGVSVESLPAATDCQAGLFLDGSGKAQTVTDNGVDYSFATTTQGAAGNRYEEDVWAIPEGTTSCLAVRYLIHSSVFENYPAGTVTEFDRAALVSQFDQIRHSLIVP